MNPQNYDIDKLYIILVRKYNQVQKDFFKGFDKMLDQELNLEPNNIRIESTFFHPFEYMVNEINKGEDKIPPAIKEIPLNPAGKTDREIIIKLHKESKYYDYFF